MALSVYIITDKAIAIICMVNLLLYKAEKPSVCTFLHADISIASAWIETGLVRNESCVFEDHKVYFYKPIVLSRRSWSPPQLVPGPSAANYVAVDGPPGPIMAAMDGPLCCKWSSCSRPEKQWLQPQIDLY